MSARRKAASKAAGQPSKAIPADEVPTIGAIFEALIEAHAVVYVACRFMEESEDDDYGHGVFALRLGVAALEQLLKLTERAALQAEKSTEARRCP